MSPFYNVRYIVKFTDVFSEKPKEVKSYLLGIDRQYILSILCDFLVRKESDFVDYIEFVNMFCFENQKFANDLFFKLIEIRNTHHFNLGVIFPYTILQLFEISFDVDSPSKFQNLKYSQRNLIKAILILNDQLSSKLDIAFDSAKNSPSSIRGSTLFLTQSLSQSDILNYDIKEVIITQMIKSIYLFEFMEEHPNTQNILKAFLEFFKSKNSKEFLKKYFPLIDTIINVNNSSHVNLIIKKDENYEKNCNFINKISISENDIVKDYDFIKIRSKPFYKLKDGVYRVIYSLFIAELLHKGLFFKLSEFNNSLNNDQKISNFRSFYCDEFSEKHLLYKSLNGIFEDSDFKISGEAIRNMKIKSEPDYYTRQDNAVLLFESKDILLSAEVKQSFDFNEYEKELRKKLYSHGNKNKAVLQLAFNVKRILQHNFSFDIGLDPFSVLIYPIIVVHDNQFNTGGLNNLINFWFKKELLLLEQNGLNVDRVRPITIIDISSLLMYQDYLKNEEFYLYKIINAYFRFVFKHVPKVEPAHIPFADFIRDYIGKRKPISQPKMLDDLMMKIYE